MNRRPNQQSGQAQGNNRNRRRRGGNSKQNSRGPEGQPLRQQEAKPPEPVRKAPPKLKRYGIIFYDNHSQAREDLANLQLKSSEVDQLNIVIKAEGTMEDAELLKYGKLYAGEAWHLIHKRRVDDGWYNEPHE